MKKFILIIALILFVVVIPHAAEVNKTLTFEWNQPGDLTYLKEWRLYWGDTAGGPYDVQEVAIIPFTGGSTIYSGQVSPVVKGNPATHVTKYFVLVACGDVPQSDKTTKYECSENSNEVSHDFWIPAVGFSAPVTFQIKPTE